MTDLIKNIIARLLGRERTVETIVSPLTKIIRELKEHSDRETAIAFKETNDAEALALKAANRRDESKRAAKTATQIGGFIGAN